MKRFYCYKCDEYSRRIEAQIPVTVQAELLVHDDGRVSAVYAEDTIYELALKPEELLCGCGAIVIITEDPCDHRWGATAFGYGNAIDQIRRQCRECGKIEYGKGTRPVWD